MVVTSDKDTIKVSSVLFVNKVILENIFNISLKGSSNREELSETGKYR